MPICVCEFASVAQVLWDAHHILNILIRVMERQVLVSIAAFETLLLRVAERLLLALALRYAPVRGLLSANVLAVQFEGAAGGRLQGTGRVLARGAHSARGSVARSHTHLAFQNRDVLDSVETCQLLASTFLKNAIDMFLEVLSSIRDLSHWEVRKHWVA